MKDIGTFTWKEIRYDLYYDEEGNSAEAIPVSLQDDDSLIRFEVAAESEEEAIRLLKDKIMSI